MWHVNLEVGRGIISRQSFQTCFPIELTLIWRTGVDPEILCNEIRKQIHWHPHLIY